jgi:hypothetical protein
LEQDILAHKCLLTEQEHKLFTFADRKVGVSCVRGAQHVTVGARGAGRHAVCRMPLQHADSGRDA